MNAHIHPFDTIDAMTEGRALRRPLSSRQVDQLEKLYADLRVAAVALDAGLQRIKNERLNVKEAPLFVAQMQCGQIARNIEDVLRQAKSADEMSAAAHRLNERLRIA